MGWFSSKKKKIELYSGPKPRTGIESLYGYGITEPPTLANTPKWKIEERVHALLQAKDHLNNAIGILDYLRNNWESLTTDKIFQQYELILKQIDQVLNQVRDSNELWLGKEILDQGLYDSYNQDVNPKKIRPQKRDYEVSIGRFEGLVKKIDNRISEM